MSFRFGVKGKSIKEKRWLSMTGYKLLAFVLLGGIVATMATLFLNH